MKRMSNERLGAEIRYFVRFMIVDFINGMVRAAIIAYLTTLAFGLICALDLNYTWVLFTTFILITIVVCLFSDRLNVVKLPCDKELREIQLREMYGDRHPYWSNEV